MDRGDISWKLRPFERLTAEELYQVMRLRSEVFVVEQQCVYLDTDNKDQDAFHLLGYQAERLVAYARLFPAGGYFEEVAIGRIVTAPEIRRQGVGKALMEESLEIVRRMYGPGPVRIGAQEYLVPFYALFGFEVSGQEYLEDGIPHVEMVLP